jgi:hypothetical protein
MGLVWIDEWMNGWMKIMFMLDVVGMVDGWVIELVVVSRIS